MRTLGIHADSFAWKSTERAMPDAERITEHALAVDGDCIVVYISIEKDDEKNPPLVAQKLVNDTRKRAEQLNCRKVVVYPYVHLTETPSSPAVALDVLKRTEELLADGLDVLRAPFGWYKAFTIACKGHPLSEWSGRFTPEADEDVTVEEIKKKATAGAAKFSRYIAVDMEGNAFDITRDDFAKSPVFKNKQPAYKLLKQFIRNEFGMGESKEKQPEHIAYMRRHELVDYCPPSEKGHYKWYPKGVLMYKLILDYAEQLATEWGALQMRNPIVIRGDDNVVGELMGEFHERDYRVNGGRGTCYLRYASDPLGFPFMQNVRFTYKQTPLKVYEEATCFRNEQEGEVSGLKRVRNFMMTDMHAACGSVNEAKREYEALCIRFGDLMNTLIARDRWVLGWEGTVQFYEDNKDYLLGIGKKLGVPAFFKLMPEMSHYYAIKNEYQSITEDLSNIQVSTVQWDVKDGERFNIGFIDADGRKHPCPVIIHASSFGSIERTLCTILENIAIDAKSGVPPMFPLWLSPTQARVVNVSEDFAGFAEDLTRWLTTQRVRADWDDRSETVGKKIRNSEKEWVPYTVVVGEKEAGGALLTVRRREDKQQVEMTRDDLVKLIHDQTAGLPYRPLPVPMQVSRRPVFYG